MAITLRSDKSSALTHVELDGNFTDLDGRLQTAEGEIDTLQTDVGTLQTDVGTLQTDVAALPDVTDGTVNLNVSSVTSNAVNSIDIDVSGQIIVNSSLTENRPMIVEANSDSINEVAKFIRPSGSTGTRSALVTHTEFSSNVTAGQGTGIWSTLKAANTGLLSLSGIQSELRSYTSDTDYVPVLKLYTMDDNSGANLKSIIEASTDEVTITNTARMNITSGVAFNLAPVNYGDLPSSPQQGDIAYLLNDGASNPQNQPIYYEGSQWQYFNGNPVASS